MLIPSKTLMHLARLQSTATNFSRPVSTHISSPTHQWPLDSPLQRRSEQLTVNASKVYDFQDGPNVSPLYQISPIDNAVQTYQQTQQTFDISPATFEYRKSHRCTTKVSINIDGSTSQNPLEYNANIAQMSLNFNEDDNVAVTHENSDIEYIEDPLDSKPFENMDVLLNRIPLSLPKNLDEKRIAASLRACHRFLAAVQLKGKSSIKNLRYEESFLLRNAKYFKSLPLNAVVECIDVLADGNCGYRALATIITGNEENWLPLRIFLLNEFLQNFKKYHDLFLKSIHCDLFNTYMRLRGSNGYNLHHKYWFNQINSSLIAANALKCPIVVFNNGGNSGVTYIPDSCFPDESPNPSPILISNAFYNGMNNFSYHAWAINIGKQKLPELPNVSIYCDPLMTFDRKKQEIYLAWIQKYHIIQENKSHS